MGGRSRIRRGQLECLEPRHVMDGSVVINEVMYHPLPAGGAAEADYEFVELYNQMSIPMDISGWRLEGGVSYTFAEGTVIPGRGYAVIASNPTALTATGGTQIAPGAFSGSLSNSGEEIVLVNNSGRRMSVVDYKDNDPWTSGPDGSGFSLAKGNEYADSSLASNWRASREVGGTPGTSNFPGGNDSTSEVKFNEIAAASSSGFWIEIANHGTSAVNLAGYQIKNTRGAGATYTFSSQTLAAGQVLLLSQSTLGFSAASGDNLFFYSAGQDQLLDAKKVTGEVRGLAPGQGDAWLYPTVSTPGAANVFQFNTDIVINEIMYHAMPQYPVASVTETNALVQINATQQWRYSQPFFNLGNNWATVAHPSWAQGPGVLGRDSTPPAILNTYPIRTTLNAPGSVITSYYETTFTFNGDLDDVEELLLGHIVDDGAVFYLNGVEVLRYNMPTGTLASNTRPVSGIEASYVGPVSIPKSALVAGTNRLSVEVRQVSNSTDVLMGAELFVKQTVVSAIPYAESPEEWIELYNKGTAAVDVSGWRFNDAIDYVFPTGTIIPAGGYLVVANDATALKGKYPEAASVIVGNFSGKLANSSDNIELLDAGRNPVDSVRYYDSANWHEKADGGGSSLELRSPQMDNSRAEAWASSIESDKSEWQTYTYTQVAAADTGPLLWNEFLFGFLQSGEVLLDDISVIVNPGMPNATELIQNGTFEGDTLDAAPLKWRIIGNHHGTVVVDPTNPTNKVLELIATGRTDHEGNNAGTTFVGNTAIVDGLTYQVSFRAKWLSGSPQLNTRAYMTRVTDTLILAVPDKNGTPGAQNSNYVENAGPTYSDFKHGPVLPSPGQAVTVTVRVDDPDEVASMALFYLVEGASFQSVAMSLDPNGLYSGSIPGQAAGVSVQFYVQGTDGLGASSTFPAEGANSRAMFEVNDGLGPTTAIESIRIVANAEEANDLLDPTNIMSNQNIRATIIYNNSEVFYDVGLRLKGSSASRGNATWGGSYAIEFNPDQLFRGVYDEIALDSSGGPSSNSQQQSQILVNQVLNHAGHGLGSNYDDFVYVISPNAAHTGVDTLQLARYSDDYLDEMYGNGSEGYLYEYELIYWTNLTTEGTSVSHPESPKLQPYKGVVRVEPKDLGNDPDQYRWVTLLKNNRDEQVYDQIMAMMKAYDIESSSEFIATISEIIDVDQWLRTFAAATVLGVGDTLATAGNPHNIVFYVRPSDGKIEMLPWDWDGAFLLGATSTIHPGNAATGTLRRLLSYTNDHLYFHHLYDLVTNEMTTQYMSYWVNTLGTLGNQDSWFFERLNYIAQRRTSVLNQINSFVNPSTQFNITTGNGNPQTVNTPTITLSGTGYVDFHHLRLQGSSQPLKLTWTNYTTWHVEVPLATGLNNVVLEAYDVRGNLKHTDSIQVTTTNAASTPLDSLRITEMNYHPPDPTSGSVSSDPEDYEFIEFTNIGSTPINLAGVRFTAGITYTFPDITLAPGEYVVIARNAAAMFERYGISIPTNQIYPNNLSNSGERVTLVDASGATILDFTYLDGDWIPAADGEGYTMVIVDPLSSTSSWNQSGGWRSSYYLYGSPGGPDLLYALGDYNRDGVVDPDDYGTWKASYGSTTNLAADGNGNGIIDLGDYTIWRDNLGATTPVPIIASLVSPVVSAVSSPENDPTDADYLTSNDESATLSRLATGLGVDPGTTTQEPKQSGNDASPEMPRISGDTGTVLTASRRSGASNVAAPAHRYRNLYWESMLDNLVHGIRKQEERRVEATASRGAIHSEEILSNTDSAFTDHEWLLDMTLTARLRMGRAFDA